MRRIFFFFFEPFLFSASASESPRLEGGRRVGGGAGVRLGDAPRGRRAGVLRSFVSFSFFLSFAFFFSIFDGRVALIRETEKHNNKTVNEYRN